MGETCATDGRKYADWNHLTAKVWRATEGLNWVPIASNASGASWTVGPPVVALVALADGTVDASDVADCVSIEGGPLCAI